MKKPKYTGDYERIEVTRFWDIETMDYLGGRRIQPGNRNEPGQYYQVIGFALQDLGIGRKEYEYLLTSHKKREDAFRAAAKVSMAQGGIIVDLTGGK